MLAQWLLQQRLRHVALASRSGLLPAKAVAVLVGAGYNAAISLAKCDAGFAADAATTLRLGETAWTGLVHAGGVLADATISNQTAAGVRAVFAPKVSALRHISRELYIQPVQTSILFSSMAALLGSVGQLNYSMANSWLDAAADSHQAAGFVATSIQFGAWKGAGMAAASAAKMEAIGLGALTPATGLSAVHGLLASAAALPPRIALSPIEWPAFLGNAQPAAPFFNSFAHLKNASQAATTASPTSSGAAAQPSALAGAGMDDEQRMPYLLAQITAAAKSIIGQDVSASEPLMAAGLDSLGAVELRNSLEGRLGMQLPSTLVFDYPTVAAIAAFVKGTLSVAPAPDAMALAGPTGDQPRDLAQSALGMALALTGLATRSPGDVMEQALAVDTLATVPASRWDVELSLTQDMPVRFGGFVSDPYLFDAAVFSVTSTEAVLMDPQQRLLLECTQEALGAAQVPFSNDVVGVFIGISSPDYADMAKIHSEISAYSATGDRCWLDAYHPCQLLANVWHLISSGCCVYAGSALSVAAGRISYLYGYKGPSVSIDTACSSSLVGTHMVRLSLGQGSCSAAISAGVKLILTPALSAMFNRAGMLTADGRCKTLDAAADGYVRGEAVVASILQLVSEGAAAATPALCLVHGSAVSQDGRSSTLTAPNGPAQQAVIRQALQSGGLSASSIGMVQLHGTGTPLGDPIEVGALAAVVAGSSGEAQPGPGQLQRSHLSRRQAHPDAGAVSDVQPGWHAHGRRPVQDSGRCS